MRYLLVMIALMAIAINFYNLGKTGRKIHLPEAAHHTIGELPIVEQFDDGDVDKKISGKEKGRGNYWDVDWNGPSSYFEFVKTRRGYELRTTYPAHFGNSQFVIPKKKWKKCRVVSRQKLDDPQYVSCKNFFKMSDEERLEKLWK